MYRALAHAAQERKLQGEPDESALAFDARVEEVGKEMKLVVKHTFFDVDDSSEASSEDEGIVLPEAFFKTTEEIDAWRRDYRRFRLGHHSGAKGEVTDKDFGSENLESLDLRPSLLMQ